MESQWVQFADMRVCNREVLRLASSSWLEFWSDYGDNPGAMLWRCPDLLNLEGDEQASLIADLARNDLGPWLRGWPEAYCDSLRLTLEHSLLHDHEYLNSYIRQTSLEVLLHGNAVDWLWRPLWDEVFDDTPIERPALSYRVLTFEEGRERLEHLGPLPAQPEWTWLDDWGPEKERRALEANVAWWRRNGWQD